MLDIGKVENMGVQAWASDRPEGLFIDQPISYGSRLDGGFSSTAESFASRTAVGIVEDPRTGRIAPVSPEFGGGLARFNVYPVHVSYTRTINYQDEQGRKVEIAMHVNAAFSAAEWGDFLRRGRPTRTAVLDLNCSSVIVNLWMRGSHQDEGHLYHGRLVQWVRDNSIRQAVSGAMTTPRIGNVRYHAYALSGALDPDTAIAQQYQWVKMLLDGIDMDARVQRARARAEREKGFFGKLWGGVKSFFSGVGKALWTLVTEPFLMAWDLARVGAAALGLATGLYHYEPKMTSAIGKMAEQGMGSGEILYEMGKGIVLTPYRLGKAIWEGDWEAAGQEATFLATLIFGPKGAKAGRGGRAGRVPKRAPKPGARARPPAKRALEPSGEGAVAPKPIPPKPAAAPKTPAARTPRAAEAGPKPSPQPSKTPVGEPAAAAPKAVKPIPGKVAQSLTREGKFTREALQTLQEAGFDLSSTQTRFFRQLHGLKIWQQNFINNFHHCKGFDRVVKSWQAGGRSRVGANFVMRYAAAKLKGKQVAFEWPVSRRITRTGAEVPARHIDIVVQGSKLRPGGSLRMELKSWTEASVRRGPGKLARQLVRDTAFFEPEALRWVFDARKIRPEEAVGALVRIIEKDPFLRKKWGGTHAQIRAAVEKLVEVF